MANKEMNTATLTKGKESAKKSIQKIHDTIVDTTEEILTSTIKTGEKWQKLMADTIKKSEPLREKQIDMVFDTAESLKKQVEHTATRTKNLLGIEEVSFDSLKDKITKIPVIKRFRAEVEEMVEDVTESPVVKKMSKVATKIKVEMQDTYDEVADKVEEVIDDVMDKVEDKMESFTQVDSKNDLKVIDGIGPKLETVLNEAGIYSYADLAKMSEKKIQTILDEAGPRYRMHNPADWKAQAKLASTGKFDELTTWIKNKKEAK
jgi:predicted flap endonuclease-1-like 5' DNA nuclease